MKSEIYINEKLFIILYYLNDFSVYLSIKSYVYGFGVVRYAEFL